MFRGLLDKTQDSSKSAHIENKDSGGRYGGEIWCSAPRDSTWRAPGNRGNPGVASTQLRAKGYRGSNSSKSYRPMVQAPRSGVWEVGKSLIQPRRSRIRFLCGEMNPKAWASGKMQLHCPGQCQTGGPSSNPRTQEIDFWLKKHLDTCLNTWQHHEEAPYLYPGVSSLVVPKTHQDNFSKFRFLASSSERLV